MSNFDFKAVSCSGSSPPKVAFHTCSLVQNKFYIFGGLDDKKSVQNRVYCYDPLCNEWKEITRTDNDFAQKSHSKSRHFGGVQIHEAPKLSHHTANVINECCIVFIGGWTGHKRSSDAYYYDTVDNTWFQIQVQGDIPAGLSSHTATQISDNELLVIGREGGIRTQRRSGDAFYFNVKTGAYKEAHLHVSSRSGHTANLVKTHLGKSYVLFVQGGRKGDEYQLIGSWNKKPGQQPVLDNDKITSFLSKWKACEKPSGRQHCVSVELSDRFLLLFGGETWAGVRNNVTNEIYILDCCKMKWYSPLEVGKGIPCLTGHTMGMVNDKVFVFGGLLDGKCTDNVWMVDL
ncbi:kelch domain-containing protein 9-like [Dendronephthya gigantea]|uniref:kelch domain-containing protein 9-like n=1 Tax=Dendronephthya gigantea TaxID=151771 RepID=UPI00106C07D1|nr:kelch domain-containing protein 9-like [Dendronephthya gigantea]